MTDISSVQIHSSETSEFSAQDYNHVVKVAELSSIDLLNVKSKFRPGGVVDEKCKLSFGRKVISCGYDDNQKAAVAVFQYFVKGRQGSVEQFSISAEYSVLYFFSESVAANAAGAFVHNVGVFAAYAYFRALAAHLAWSANLELPPLPMIASQAYKPKD